MAEEMKNKAWKDYGLQRVKPIFNKYPWERWLNGSMWLLLEGEDYAEGQLRSFRNYLYDYCYSHNIKVKTQQNEFKTGLYIKATDNTTTEGLRRSRHFRQLRRNRHERIRRMNKNGDSLAGFDPDDVAAALAAVDDHPGKPEESGDVDP